MSTAISEKYREAARTKGAEMEKDYKASNRAHRSLMGVLKEIRSMPDKGAELLGGLLHDSDGHVVCTAATHLLPLREKEARDALARLSENERGLARFNAKMVLQEWDAGRLKIE